MSTIEDKQKQYAGLVIEGLLRLKEGDALSVNCEEKDIAFARIVCNQAVLKTNVTVKLVMTLDGRPTEVIDFEPEGLASQTKGFAMLRLAHVEEKDCSDCLETYATDMASMQKYGHLADPVVLDRRIAVPWCVIPVGKDIDSILEKISNIDDKTVMTRFRRQNLEHMDIHRMEFSSPLGTFSVCLDEDTPFISGISSTPSGRGFITGPDFGDITFNVDRSTLCGVVCGSAYVFGKKVDVRLEYSDGRLVSYSPCLERLLGMDPLLCLPGSVTFNDKRAILTLGGGNPDGLKVSCESEIPCSFNSSIYKLDIDLGSSFDISVYNCSGSETKLVQSGYFISL